MQGQLIPWMPYCGSKIIINEAEEYSSQNSLSASGTGLNALEGKSSLTIIEQLKHLPRSLITAPY